MKTRDSLGFDWLWLLIGLGVLVRLVFIPLLNLLPEEAYYWNYAAHLDWGYLDHPPLTAWLISASEALFGRSEFAVRLPAFLMWFLFVFFMYRFAENTIAKGMGKTVILLLVFLPIYMSVGFLMTPDAPLYVCWAGALFFLERAILAERPAAWFGAGACLGFGMLAKYTMILIIPATVVFLLVDKVSRRGLLKPQPYLALLIGFILFFPVLYWNARHDWISFAFQSTQRWQGKIDFQFHILVGSVLVLITPLGLYHAIKVMVDFWKRRRSLEMENQPEFRRQLFMATFTLVPLAVFVIQSLQGQPKINWTGPVWLAILPLIASDITRAVTLVPGRKKPVVWRRWLVTAVVLLILYAGGFTYLVAGMPGLTAESGMKFPIAWREYGDRIEKIEEELEAVTGKEPIIIGMDKYWLASEAGFYDPDDSDLPTEPPYKEAVRKPGGSEVFPEVGGENLIGGNSLMWNFWVSPHSIAGRNALLVSFSEDKLDKPWVARHFFRLGDINKEVLTYSDREIGFFYWRTGYNYIPE